MVPVVGNVPLQPPEAVQEVASEAVHCNVTDAPMATLLSLAFRLTNGGVTTAGVVAAPVAVSVAALGDVVAVLGDVKALELEPHAASALSALNTNTDFNANANPEQRLRRIELITRLPRFTTTTFCAELDSILPQSLRSHNHSIFRIRQPVAICELHMFSVRISSFAFSKIEKLRTIDLVAHWRQRCSIFFVKEK